MTETLLAGVELGGTKCICVLGTATGGIAETVRLSTETPDRTLAAIEAVLDGWRGRFGALGVASFGPVDLDPASPGWGSITSTTKRGWIDTDVAGRLGRRYAMAADFDTDVVGAALAEARWGAGQGLGDLAYVTVGTGVGVGLLVGGTPIRGFTHTEIGHVRVKRMAGDGWPGACAYHGDCVEGLASGPAILARTGTQPSEIDPADPVWDLVADTLAQMLHAIVLFASPRRILLGGGVMSGQPQLFPKVRARLQAGLGRYVRSPYLEGGLADYVVPPALGERAGLLGALAVASPGATG